MPTYLDVAAVRIQSYIARTPALRLRRGASWLLTTATATETVTQWLADDAPPGVSVNAEAGHADGVISLIVPEQAEWRVAEQVLSRLREQLPATELQAVWATADSYLEAFPLMAAERACPMVALPAIAEFGLGETCAQCRVDIRSVGGEVCVDCRARDDAAGRRTASPGTGGVEDASATEWMLLEATNKSERTMLRPVRHFGDLAQMGKATGNGNHVATVALDGNGIGAFFAALAGTGDADLKRRVSPAVSAATRHALLAATTGIVGPTDRRLPVVPHVLGGDDIVVSIVADRAWAFVDRFLNAFAEAFAEAADDLRLPDEARGRIPTMSAGLVFAHYKFPYARAVGLAEQMLRRAKRDTQGAEPAVCWLDVTSDGEELPAWRRAFTLRELTEHAPALQSIAALGNTGRQVMQRLLASDTQEEASAAVFAWARRNGHTAIQTLPHSIPIGDLRCLAAFTRWWRP